MNIAELKELLELIASSSSNITEFELEEEGVKLRIKKGGNSLSSGVAPAIVASVPAPPVNEASSAAASPASASAEVVADGLAIVTAPMVGTFYRQPEPGGEPFVSKGDPIKKGQVLCIIEAMKLMNEIESDYSGELVDVFVEDGQSVQYGDKLFAIREM